MDNPLWLAPMAGVTDLAYRKICKKFGCDIVVTEMVSAKALDYRDKKTWQLMTLDEQVKPIVLQIFGSEPEVFKRVITEVINDLNIVALDINMGCPAPKIVKNGDGSALMKDIDLAKRLVDVAKSVSNNPVTVKMRIGWDEKSINGVAFAKAVAQAGADGLAVHGRTREQMYSGKADWSIIKQIVEEVTIPVVGNGDIFTPEDALAMHEKTGCAGLMIGRGAQGRPWLFKQIKDYLTTGSYQDAPDLDTRIEIIKEQMQYMLINKPEFIAVLEMRKHIAWYLKGLANTNQIKTKVNRAKSFEEMIAILKAY